MDCIPDYREHIIQFVQRSAVMAVVSVRTHFINVTMVRTGVQK